MLYFRSYSRKHISGWVGSGWGMWTVDQFKRQDGQVKHHGQGGLNNDKRAGWLTSWVINRVVWPFSQIQQNRRRDNTYRASLPSYLRLEIEAGRNEYFPSNSSISTVISADKWPAGPKDPHPRLLAKEPRPERGPEGPRCTSQSRLILVTAERSEDYRGVMREDLL